MKPSHEKCGTGFEQVEYVLLPRALERAQQIRAKKEIGHKMEDCIGGKAYTEDFVGKSIDEVKAHEEGILENLDRMDPHERKRRETATKLAKCLEAIILNVKSWFGPTSTIYPATKFDDYFNGVDLIAERMSDGIANHHGFALDVTYAGEEIVIKKIRKIIEKIKRGELGSLDFFKSKNIVGRLSEIPLVVIGVDSNTMKGLINLFAEKEDAAIEVHPIQFQIIEQVILQCDLFIEIAQKLEDGEVSRKIVDAYSTLKKDFESIRSLSIRLNPNIPTNMRDLFHERLVDIIERVKRTP